jgi:hypothetical protein
MEDLFGTLVGLIPIAAIIAIRLFASMKKGQSQPASRRAEIFEEHDEEKSFRPHWELDDDDRPARPRPAPAVSSKFWERPDRNRGAIPARQSASRTKFQETIRAYEKKASAERAAFSGAVLSGAVPPSAAQAAPVPEHSPSGAAPRALNEARAQSSIFPENLACYTPLQRAVIMAEILGPPRGLK